MAEYEAQVKGFKGAISKKFPTEQAAWAFIGKGLTINVQLAKSTKPYDKPARLAKTTTVKDEWARDYYGVKKGKRPGVYTSWHEAERQVNGVDRAAYKRFATRAEAEAYITSKETRTKKPRRRLTYSTSTWNLPDSLFLHSSHNHTTYRPPELPFHVQEAREQGFTVGPDGVLVVYTDGSARKNGSARCKAGSGVYWGRRGHAETLNLAERVPGLLQTNNRAELLGIVRALETCPFPDLPLEIRTDSQYSISCITQFLPIWLRNNFRLSTGEAVKNQDMIVHILALLNQRGRDNSVKFVHVRAHRGEVGDEFADRLANTAARMPVEPERTDWFTLEDVHRHAVARRRGQTVFRRTREDGRSGGDDEYEATDAESEYTDADSESGDGADLEDSDAEFGGSDTEFDKIIAEYEELYEGNEVGDEGDGDSDGEAVPDTCQEVEELVPVEVEQMVPVHVPELIPAEVQESVSLEVEVEIDPSWLLSQEEMADLEADL